MKFLFSKSVLVCCIRYMTWYLILEWVDVEHSDDFDAEDFTCDSDSIKSLNSFILDCFPCFISLLMVWFIPVSSFNNLFVLMQVLGTPTREEIKCMNPNYTEFKFPHIKAYPLHKVIGCYLTHDFSIL